MEGKVISIRAKGIRVMIKQYLVLLTPVHKLSPKEVELLTEIIYEYLKRRGDFAKEEYCWEQVFMSDAERAAKNYALGIEDVHQAGNANAQPFRRFPQGVDSDLISPVGSFNDKG